MIYINKQKEFWLKKHWKSIFLDKTYGYICQDMKLLELN